ncbi:heat shock transcription factor, putative [Entamoeba histolytica HM-1:IMSS-B]|uniref:Heat shock transcription factor, putative n=4 Tax=Entamoeba histolytica TaxID=5759 RepID=C4LW57_ENTH1|nr:heat shock transcription factor, putative [Entamoeba histolytica HM-1:IMSS]EAL45389.2 heat shock transcription factor, putative [Entamoeba histolytica HM-1:IMSS]EMH75718.1 heat shock transcription factor, putative [Entamoeba histolytica HM-1:IMSS-B]ENY65042.1 heat shock transcription factor, putative [Entamoeba histolytica HM-1:IMSS-A]GAT92930.1 heat shock transcription factor putative [Entamoeba histolytica]|eukprot:XP_650767.2 heat shock transcription factor, putative [Entamoeba histolytica HM-1:IMSS]
MENKDNHISGFPQEFSQFLVKLFEMLNDKESKRIVEYNKENHGFFLYDKQLFVDYILPKHFPNVKQESFIRQLNGYDFHKKVIDGQDCFVHESFDPTNFSCIKTIKRKKVKRQRKGNEYKPMKNNSEVFKISPSSLEQAEELLPSLSSSLTRDSKTLFIERRYLTNSNGGGFAIDALKRKIMNKNKDEEQEKPQQLNEKKEVLINENDNKNNICSNDDKTIEMEQKTEINSGDKLSNSGVQKQVQSTTHIIFDDGVDDCTSQEYEVNKTLKTLQESVNSLEKAFTTLQQNQNTIYEEVQSLSNVITTLLSIFSLSDQSIPQLPKTDRKELEKELESETQ